MIQKLKNINWEKWGNNVILFAGPNLITALLATQTNLLPQLVKSPAYLSLLIIIENFVIDLIRKYIEAETK